MNEHWSDLPDFDGDHDLSDAHHWHHDDLGLHADDLPDDTPDLLHHDVDTAVGGDVFTDVYGVDVSAVVERLGLPDELDSVDAAVVLNELGLDATALHGDVDGLAARVEAGEEVVVDGPSGRLAVVGVSEDLVQLQDRTGALLEAPLAQFEDAWAAGSYAMVVAEPLPATGEILLDTGPVTVLGMTWPVL